MGSHPLTPVRPLQDQSLGLPRVALHVGFDELLQDVAHVFSHFIDGLCAKHGNIVLDLIMSVLADELKLRVKAVIELLMQCLDKLGFHSIKYFSIVLSSRLCEVSACLANHFSAPLVEVLNDALVAIYLKLIDQRFHFGKGLILNLIASEVCDHEHLSGQIEILLLTNDIPCLLDINWHTIYGDLIVRSVTLVDKEFIVTCRVKASLNLFTFLLEGVRFENFVRHHDEFKREEVFGGGVSILLGFVDLTPDLFKVLVDHRLDLREWNITGVITQDEEEFLGGMLVKQLQIDLKDHLEQAVV